MEEMLFPREALAVLREARHDPHAHCGFALPPYGFNWSDERLLQVRAICRQQGSRAHLYLLAYRTSLIRSEPIEEYRAPWDQLQVACPEWPGFRPERCSTKLASHLERIRVCMALLPDHDTGLLLISLLLVCSMPLVLALPVGVQLIARNLAQGPTDPWLWAGIVAVVAGILFCKGICWMVAGTFGVLSEVTTYPLGSDEAPRGIEVRLIEGATVLGQRLITILLFGMIMDGGVYLQACCYAYLGYEVGVLLLLARRWQGWTKVERFYLRWGWAPIIGFGVPWLLPTLKALGLVRIIA